MPFCRSCGRPFQWGQDENGRWVLLEPTDSHKDMDRTYVDENGELRADHRDRCNGPAVNVQRLEKKVSADFAPYEEQAYKRRFSIRKRSAA